MPGTFSHFHLAEGGELDGLALSRWISRLGVDPSGPATFAHGGETGLLPVWQRWLRDLFSPWLAPTVVAVHRASRAGRWAELVGADQALDRHLPREVRERSVAAGRAFLKGKSEMKANREWVRLAQKIEAGETSGHAATLLATQGALYHLPLASTLAAYVWFELESGLPGSGYRDRSGTSAEALEAFSAALPRVAVAMDGDRGEFGDSAPRLRAI